jgi:DNA topoisomerase-2
LYFSRFRASWNIGEKEFPMSGFRGMSAIITNICSSKFIVDIVSSGQKLKYHQEFRNNMSEMTVPEVTSVSEDNSSTMITFYPDFKLFGMDGFDADTITALGHRVQDIASIFRDCRVSLNGEKVLVDRFPMVYQSHLGSRYELVASRINKKWLIGVTVSQNSVFAQFSFVNGLETNRGGTHVEYVTKQIVEAIVSRLSGDVETAESAERVKSQLYVFVSVIIENPVFNGKNKEELCTRVEDFGSEWKINDVFVDSIMESVISDYIQYRGRKVRPKILVHRGGFERGFKQIMMKFGKRGQAMGGFHSGPKSYENV